MRSCLQTGSNRYHSLLSVDDVVTAMNNLLVTSAMYSYGGDETGLVGVGERHRKDVTGRTEEEKEEETEEDETQSSEKISCTEDFDRQKERIENTLQALSQYVRAVQGGCLRSDQFVNQVNDDDVVLRRRRRIKRRGTTSADSWILWLVGWLVGGRTSSRLHQVGRGTARDLWTEWTVEWSRRESGDVDR